MVKRKNSILSCLTLVLCLIISMPAVIWASETMVSSLYGAPSFGGSPGDVQAVQDTPEIVSEVNSLSSAEKEVSGNIIAASSGVEYIPSLLKDGSYGMVKGQKWFAGPGASSSDKKIFSVNSKGIVSAKRAGTAEITMYGTKHKITVAEPKLSKTKVSLSTGDTAKVSLNGLGEGQKLSWMSQNGDIAQVYEGKIYATGIGNTKVYACSGGKRYRISVRVTEKKGTTILLDAPVAKEKKIPLPDAALSQWKVSNNSVSVKNGKVKATSAGMYLVSDETGRKIRLYGNDPMPETGTGLFETGRDNQYALKMKTGEKFFINCPKNHECPIWKSSSPFVASVDAYGVIYADSPGNARLTAKTGGKKITVSVTVGNESTLITGNSVIQKQIVDNINGNAGVYVTYDTRTGKTSEEKSGDVRNPSDNGIPDKDPVTDGHEDQPGNGEGNGNQSGNGEGNGNQSGNGEGSGEQPGNGEGSGDQPGNGEENGDRPGSGENGGETKNCTVRFNSDGGSSVPDQKVKYAGKAAEPEAPVKEHYDFDKWYKGEYLYDFNNAVVENIILKAHWTPKVYDLSFDACGGEIKESIRNIKYGTAAGTLPVPEKEHYDFDGWFTSPEAGTRVNAGLKISGDTEIYAHWKAKVYTVSFNAMGGSCNTGEKTVTYGAAYGILPVPVKKGQNFRGWFLEDSETERITSSSLVDLSGNITLYALWSPKEIKLTFDGNGGTGGITEKTVIFGEEYGDLPLAERKGYSFVGWALPESKGATVSSGNIVTDDEDTTLYAMWKVNSYNVIFDANGGTCQTYKAEVKYDSTYGTLPHPQRSGYSFAGWYTSLTGGTAVEPSTVVSITEDQTLYAYWKANSYKLTFNANGGSCSESSKTITFDSKYGTLPTPTRVGYTFSGWFTATSGGTQRKAGTVVSVLSNETVYARWTANSYKVTFNANGGSCSTASMSVTYGAKYGTLPTPTYKGYTFAGWYTATSGGSNITVSTVVSITANQTLYARWTANKYKVTFNASGGSCSTAQQEVTYNSTYGKLPTPTRDGYTFKGWYTAASGGSAVTSGTKVTITANKTLYAQWTLYAYVLRWSSPLASVGSFLGTGGASAGTAAYKRIKYTDYNGNIVYTNPYKSSGRIEIKPGSTVYLEAVSGAVPDAGHYYTDITWYVGDNLAVGDDFGSHGAYQMVSSHYAPPSSGTLAGSDKWATDDNGKKNFWWHVRFTAS